MGGECTLPMNSDRDACALVQQQYLHGWSGNGSSELQIQLLTDLQSHINLCPLRHLLQLCHIVFNEDVLLNRLCHVLKLFIDRLHLRAASVVFRSRTGASQTN